MTYAERTGQKFLLICHEPGSKDNVAMMQLTTRSTLGQGIKSIQQRFMQRVLKVQFNAIVDLHDSFENELNQLIAKDAAFHVDNGFCSVNVFFKETDSHFKFAKKLKLNEPAETVIFQTDEQNN